MDFFLIFSLALERRAEEGSVLSYFALNNTIV